MSKDKWYVYIVECSDGTYYCGVTNDVKHRIVVHNAGKGAKYTKSRLPVKLLVVKGPFNKSQALSIEYSVKKQSRHRKINFLLEKVGGRTIYKMHIVF